MVSDAQHAAEKDGARLGGIGCQERRSMYDRLLGKRQGIPGLGRATAGYCRFYNAHIVVTEV